VDLQARGVVTGTLRLDAELVEPDTETGIAALDRPVGVAPGASAGPDPDDIAEATQHDGRFMLPTLAHPAGVVSSAPRFATGGALPASPEADGEEGTYDGADQTLQNQTAHLAAAAPSGSAEERLLPAAEPESYWGQVTREDTSEVALITEPRPFLGDDVASGRDEGDDDALLHTVADVGRPLHEPEPAPDTRPVAGAHAAVPRTAYPPAAGRGRRSSELAASRVVDDLYDETGSGVIISGEETMLRAVPLPEAHPRTKAWHESRRKRRAPNASAAITPRAGGIALGLVCVGIAVGLLVVGLPSRAPLAQSLPAAATVSEQIRAETQSAGQFRFSPLWYTVARGAGVGLALLGALLAALAAFHRSRVQVRCSVCRAAVAADVEGLVLRCSRANHVARLRYGTLALLVGFAAVALALFVSVLASVG
jgi:hypothetical protein